MCAQGQAALFYLFRENSFSLMRIVRTICIFNYFIMCLPNKLYPKGVLYRGVGKVYEWWQDIKYEPVRKDVTETWGCI